MVNVIKMGEAKLSAADRAMDQWIIAAAGVIEAANDLADALVALEPHLEELGFDSIGALVESRYSDRLNRLTRAERREIGPIFKQRKVPVRVVAAITGTSTGTAHSDMNPGKPRSRRSEPEQDDLARARAAHPAGKADDAPPWVDDPPNDIVDAEIVPDEGEQPSSQPSPPPSPQPAPASQPAAPQSSSSSSSSPSSDRPDVAPDYWKDRPDVAPDYWKDLSDALLAFSKHHAKQGNSVSKRTVGIMGTRLGKVTNIVNGYLEGM